MNPTDFIFLLTLTKMLRNRTDPLPDFKISQNISKVLEGFPQNLTFVVVGLVASTEGFNIFIDRWGYWWLFFFICLIFLVKLFLYSSFFVNIWLKRSRSSLHNEHCRWCCQFNLTENLAVVVSVSLLTIKPEVNGRHSHPLIHVFSCLCYFPTSPLLPLLFVGCHGNKSTVGGGLLLLKQLWDWKWAGIWVVKWSDSCTHKQRVRWGRREVERLGVRESEMSKRRIMRGPGGVSGERSQLHMFWPCF